ncbi:uridine kinase [Spiroplasma turonicum]|uniref:Uridine kinase n=1 Tax=Spiroplasma turonicum TaxID=216946 RepID=A0A0K1P6W9_9MOLU|nr:uridine kinase [Spiroplasma turonicum]AKU79627.1 uridine kinase [Spiroplasma turonicum]ALX70648.1 uridine kinase [Spiroplasma turonicum]
MEKVTIITIAGGSASGKTTFAQTLSDKIFENHSVSHLSMDNYYKDFSHLNFEERQNLNFDHPSSLDIDLICKHLDDLKNFKSIQVPIYDFTTHSQSGKFKTINPSEVVIFDGILALQVEEVRKRSNIKIFIRTDDDIRFIRRLVRDVNDRGRNLDDVINQYLTTVRPMYKFFVEPSIEHADIIVPYYEGNKIAMDLVAAKINTLLSKSVNSEIINNNKIN